MELVNPNSLVPHPRNPNTHNDAQIERLGKLILYQGFRNPVVVSKLSGCIVAGHGRTLAAIRVGLTEIPVLYQDFENEAQEYAYLVSDNAIAEWAELDFAAINDAVMDLGPDFELDMLGVKDFTVTPDENEKPVKKKKLCPSCGHEF